jgi:hypothetical protein
MAARAVATFDRQTDISAKANTDYPPMCGDKR